MEQNLLKNNMYGRVEIVEPPRIVHHITPVKDALVRKEAGLLNFGGLSTLGIGKVGDDEYRSYLSFNIKEVPIERNIDEATLVLSSITETTEEFVLEIYETDNIWAEHTIRWDYKPEELYNHVATHTVYPGNRKIEIDLKEYFNEWYQSREERSFVIIAKYQSKHASILDLGSRESFNPPILRVAYYEIPPNAGVTHLNASSIIKINEKDELDAHVNIESQFVANDLPAMTLFPKKEHDTEIPARTHIILRGLGEADAYAYFEAKHRDTEIDVYNYLRAYGFKDIDMNAIFEKKERLSEIDIGMILRAHGNLDLESNLVFVKKENANDLKAVAYLKGYNESTLEAKALFENKEKSDDLDVSVRLRAYEASDLETFLVLEEKERESELETDLFLRAYGETMLDADAFLPVKHKAAELDIHAIFEEKENILELPANAIVRIRWADELESKVTIAYRGSSEIESTVKIAEPNNGSYAFII